MNRVLLVSIQLLTVATLIWLLYPNQPLQTKGAFIKVKAPEENQGEGAVKDPKILKIDILTDANKVNFLNQKRNLDKIIVSPLNKPRIGNEEEFLGEKSPFEPLITIEAYGPLNIKIQAEKSFKELEFSIPETPEKSEGPYIVEVYPFYDRNFFKDTKGNITENISIFSQKNRGPWTKIDVASIEWSKDQDLFLSHENLIDLAALTGGKSHQIPQIKPEAWLQKMGTEIKSLNLRYETELAYKEGENQGWQRVRTLQEMIEANSANCIDLSVYVSKLALASGFNAYIIANKGHALCAISMPNESSKDALTFETTDYLKPPLKPPDKPGEKPREYLPGEEVKYPERPAPREEEKSEVFIIDLNFWSQFYQ